MTQRKPRTKALPLRLEPEPGEVETHPLSGRLLTIRLQLSAEEADALMAHLLGHTSAEWLANTLTESGYPVSATTIRTQRRAWRKDER